nr:MAG TPA: hypothetical protein [Caudoviricetes sp.]
MHLIHKQKIINIHKTLYSKKVLCQYFIIFDYIL